MEVSVKRRKTSVRKDLRSIHEDISVWSSKLCEPDPPSSDIHSHITLLTNQWRPLSLSFNEYIGNSNVIYEKPSTVAMLPYSSCHFFGNVHEDLLELAYQLQYFSGIGCNPINRRALANDEMGKLPHHCSEQGLLGGNIPLNVSKETQDAIDPYSLLLDNVLESEKYSTGENPNTPKASLSSYERVTDASAEDYLNISYSLPTVLEACEAQPIVAFSNVTITTSSASEYSKKTNMDKLCETSTWAKEEGQKMSCTISNGDTSAEDFHQSEVKSYNESIQGISENHQILMNHAYSFVSINDQDAVVGHTTSGMHSDHMSDIDNVNGKFENDNIDNSSLPNQDVPNFLNLEESSCVVVSDISFPKYKSHMLHDSSNYASSDFPPPPAEILKEISTGISVVSPPAVVKTSSKSDMQNVPSSEAGCNHDLHYLSHEGIDRNADNSGENSGKQIEMMVLETHENFSLDNADYLDVEPPLKNEGSLSDGNAECVYVESVCGTEDAKRQKNKMKQVCVNNVLSKSPLYRGVASTTAEEMLTSSCDTEIQAAPGQDIVSEAVDHEMKHKRTSQTEDVLLDRSDWEKSLSPKVLPQLAFAHSTVDSNQSSHMFENSSEDSCALVLSHDETAIPCSISLPLKRHNSDDDKSYDCKSIYSSSFGDNHLPKVYDLTMTDGTLDLLKNEKMQDKDSDANVAVGTISTSSNSLNKNKSEQAVMQLCDLQYTQCGINANVGCDAIGETLNADAPSLTSTADLCIEFERNMLVKSGSTEKIVQEIVESLCASVCAEMVVLSTKTKGAINNEENNENVSVITTGTGSKPFDSAANEQTGLQYGWDSPSRKVTMELNQSSTEKNTSKHTKSPTSAIPSRKKLPETKPEITKHRALFLQNRSVFEKSSELQNTVSVASRRLMRADLVKVKVQQLYQLTDKNQLSSKSAVTPEPETFRQERSTHEQLITTKSETSPKNTNALFSHPKSPACSNDFKKSKKVVNIESSDKKLTISGIKHGISESPEVKMFLAKPFAKPGGSNQQKKEATSSISSDVVINQTVTTARAISSRFVRTRSDLSPPVPPLPDKKVLEMEFPGKYTLVSG